MSRDLGRVWITSLLRWRESDPFLSAIIPQFGSFGAYIVPIIPDLLLTSPVPSAGISHSI